MTNTQNINCPNCGEKAEKLFKDEYRGDYYCEACRDEYWEEVEEAEGANSYGIRN